MKSTSIKKLKELIKDELKSSKDYKKRGFIRQAKQEKAHAKYFRSILNKKCGKHRR